MSITPTAQSGEFGDGQLARLTARGALFSYGAFAASKMVAFVSTALLTRLLLPQQFGLVAYALAVLQYFDVVATAGTTGAVIAAKRRVQETTNSAFVTSVLSGAALYGVAFAAAPALARFFNAPDLVAVLRVLALVVPLAGMGAVPGAVLQRALRFRARLVIDIGSSLVKAVVAVTLAAKGFGLWSLVAGQLASETTSTIVSWALAGWRPTSTWDRPAHRQMCKVAGHLISVGLAGALVSNVDYLIVGRVLGSVALGYYTLAYRVPELLLTNLNWAISRVSFPVLARTSGDEQSVRRFYFAYVRYVTLIAFPLGTGLVVVATPFVEVVFSTRWLPSAPVMQLIAVALALATISHVPGSIYKATGRTALLNRVTIAKLPVTIGGLALGARWGIAGVAGAQCALAIVHLLIDGVVIGRVARIDWRVTATAAAPAMFASSIMAAGLVGTGIATGLSGWHAIIGAVCVGSVLYLGVLALAWPEAIRHAWAAMRSVAPVPQGSVKSGSATSGPRERSLA